VKTLARADHLAEILRRLRTVRPDQPARWGRMSAHQMICHLADALCVANGEKAVTPATGVFQRTFIKWIALYAPLRWPAAIPTPAEIDQQVGGTRPQEFTADVASVESLLRRFADESGVARPEHPVFGRMSARAWLRWGYLHADHHLRQFGA
jgi:hypothetical protein